MPRPNKTLEISAITPNNPVTRARQQVEAEIPLSRRGPGWDRHWRELEAYAEAANAGWQGIKHSSTDENGGEN